jgi:hypothetical protein
MATLASGVRAGALDAARVRAHENDVGPVRDLRSPVLEEHRHRVKVIERDREEALDLPRVQVHRDDASGARGGDQVGDEFRADRRARGDFAVLARVSVIREDGRDLLRARALHGVDHDQELHQRVVHGLTGGLDDVGVAAPDVFLDLDEDFPVAEALDGGLAEGLAELFTDLVRDRAVGVPRKDDPFPHAHGREA